MSQNPNLRDAFDPSALQAHARPPEVELIDDLCRALSRLALGKKLYTGENKLLVMMRKRLGDLWGQIVENGLPFKLDIQDGSLLYRGVEIFSADDPNQFSLVLYQDGIRELTFHPSAPLETLLAFLDIFNDNHELWSPETSCIDRLWILELADIEHRAVDGVEEISQRGDHLILDSYIDALEDAVNGRAAPAVPAPMLASSPSAGSSGAGVVLRGRRRSTGANPELKRAPRASKIDYHPQALVDALEASRYTSMDIDSSWFDRDDALAVGLMRWLEVTRLALPGLGRPAGVAACDEILGKIFEARDLELLKTLDERLSRGDKYASFLIDVLAYRNDASASAERALAWAADEELFSWWCSFCARFLKLDARELLDLVIQRGPEREGLTIARLMAAVVDEPLGLWASRLEDLDPVWIEIALGSASAEQLSSRAGAALITRAFDASAPSLIAFALRQAPDDFLLARHQVVTTYLEHASSAEVRAAAVQAFARARQPQAGIMLLNALKRNCAGLDTSDAEVAAFVTALLDVGGGRYAQYIKESLGLGVKSSGGFLSRFTKPRHNNPLGDRGVLLGLLGSQAQEASSLLAEVEREQTLTYLPELLASLRAERERGAGEEAPKLKTLDDLSDEVAPIVLDESLDEASTPDAAVLEQQAPAQRRELSQQQLEEMQLGRQILHEFFSILKTSAYHAENNEALDAPVKNLVTTLNRASTKHPTIKIEIAQGQFFLNERRVQPTSRQHETIALLELFLLDRGLGGLVFNRALDDRSVRLLARALLAFRKPENHEDGVRGFGALMQRAGLQAAIEAVAPSQVHVDSPVERAFKMLGREGQAVVALAKARALLDGAAGEKLEGRGRLVVQELSGLDDDVRALLLALARFVLPPRIGQAFLASLLGMEIALELGLARSVVYDVGISALLDNLEEREDALLALRELSGREVGVQELRVYLGLASRGLPARESGEQPCADLLGEILGLSSDFARMMARENQPILHILSWVAPKVGSRYAREPFKALLGVLGASRVAMDVVTAKGTSMSVRMVTSESGHLGLAPLRDQRRVIELQRDAAKIASASLVQLSLQQLLAPQERANLEALVDVLRAQARLGH